ncbi:unnamed protein product [Sphagnum jensenii]|uniref:Uncharacterized protein n=1 Tax=Sphagnum jensenii TaxID=128206 RepID=A0ABP0XBI0_9BRYO
MAETGSRWKSTFLQGIFGGGSSSNPAELEKLIATIKRIHDLIDPGVQLNKQLCGYVDEKLLKLKALLESRYKRFVRAPESVPNDAKIVLKELYLVVKRVEVLVQKCTFKEARDQWLEVAITVANVEEDVVEMELDLAWWVSVLKVAADSNMGEPELLSKVQSAMRKQGALLEKLSKELSSLQKAAKTDRKDLLSRLEEVKKKGNINSRHGEVIASPLAEAILGDESITRVLVMGSPRAELFMKDLCFMNHDVLDGKRPNLESISEIGLDINKEWKHSRGSLCIHAASKCIGQQGLFEQIDSFLAERNSLLTSKRWLESWRGDLRIEDCRNWRTFQKVEKVNRVHVVWLLYEVFESIKFEWKHLNDILKKHEVPLQILILTNPEKDPTGEFLKRNFLGNHGFLFPGVSTSSGQVHLIMIPSHCLSSVKDMAKSYQQPFLDHLPNISSSDTLSLTHLDYRALLGSTEVIKTFSSIQKTARIISKIASLLGRKGITIDTTPFIRLNGHYTLSQSGIFTTKCLCSIWEIPLIKGRTMMRKFALWESNRADHEPSHRPEQNVSLSQSFSLSIKDGRYLPFTACAAHAIVYYRVLQLRGWTASDNSDEFDSFNSKHKKRFEEFSQKSSGGILSQLWQKLSGSFDETGLRQILQKSLEDFYIECTTGHSLDEPDSVK